MSDTKTDNQNGNSNEAIIERVKTTLKENPNSLYLMKKGDYSVHVLIEEVKNLTSIKENQLPKPIVKVTCFNQSKRTVKPPQDCDAYTFNEHIIIILIENLILVFKNLILNIFMQKKIIA